MSENYWQVYSRYQTHAYLEKLSDYQRHCLASQPTTVQHFSYTVVVKVIVVIIVIVVIVVITITDFKYCSYCEPNQCIITKLICIIMASKYNLYFVEKQKINNQLWLTTRMSLSDKVLFPPTRLRQHLRDLQPNQCWLKSFKNFNSLNSSHIYIFYYWCTYVKHITQIQRLEHQQIFHIRQAARKRVHTFANNVKNNFLINESITDKYGINFLFHFTKYLLGSGLVAVQHTSVNNGGQLNEAHRLFTL